MRTGGASNKHIGANNRRLPETPIEYHHSRMKHLIHPTTESVTIEHHKTASCLVKPAAEARVSLSAHLLKGTEVSKKFLLLLTAAFFCIFAAVGLTVKRTYFLRVVFF